MAADETLLQLLATPTEDDIRDEFLADLNAADFPITDWQSGAVMRTYVEMFTRAHFILVAQLIPKIAAGGFLTEAEDDWLRQILAPQAYGLTPIPATPTVQQATLTCDANNGPYTIAVGQLIAKTTAGRRYTNITGGALATSGTLIVQFQSEGPNDSTNDATNYIDAAGTMTMLVTPLAGVTINNPALDFAPVTLAGVGPNALVTAARTDPLTAPRPGTILIQIDQGGQVGTATFKYRRIGLDSDFQPGGATAAAVDIPVTGITIAFVNGMSNPTFISGDLFAVSSPGGPIITQGRDVETSASLIARCQARWPALSAIPTVGQYKLWALAADPQVTKVGVVADLVKTLQVNVTIGGQLNPLSGAVLANVQKYLDVRLGLFETAVVTTATTRDVVVSGFVTVPVGSTATVQQAVDAAWEAYIAAQDIAGLAKVSELQRVIGDAVKATQGSGAQYDVRDLAIAGANEGAPPNGAVLVNLRAGSSEVLSVPPGGVPSQALSWYEA